MRRMDRAHNAPVLAVHVDVRPPPGVSIDTPLSPGEDEKSVWVRAVRPTATFKQRPIVARPSVFPEQFSFRIRKHQIVQDPAGGTLRSSVVHSPGRASTIPLAWLAALKISSWGDKADSEAKSEHHNFKLKVSGKVRSGQVRSGSSLLLGQNLGP